MVQTISIKKTQEDQVVINRSPELYMYLLKAGHIPGDTLGTATFSPGA